ncbi:EboA domain-containing protein [Methylobacterium sp. SyP6R]|uniref:EboA domain-containing protein n=1 Tax=Methylobacterium sp. SyP6R TaxID=2718876 RepID=UPI001F30BE84|nr:EboA domain-containing protein [Methylobacterium sp. SyP6R]MCF4129921.1 EboA domain-containing protein [Methylobacterium sp. SyP6R]
MSGISPAPSCADAPADRIRGLLALIEGWLARAVAPPGLAWYRETVARIGTPDRPCDDALRQGLAWVPRRLGRSELPLGPEDVAAAQALRPGFFPDGLGIDQAGRIGLLLASHRDDAHFAATLAELCRRADLREHVTYLRGLPLYPGAALLEDVAAEALRSAVTPVFAALAHRNPYPAEVFAEPRWSQMVLKAVFVGLPLGPIVGLDARANPHLASMLRDFASERVAAGRPVPPDLARCLGPFRDEVFPEGS